MQKKSEALGKGIRSLLQNIDTDLKNTTGGLKNDLIEQNVTTTLVSLELIEVNPDQPRKDSHAERKVQIDCRRKKI